MKKSELKNMIKECVKEVIFEEGVLSGIITEVAKGLGSSPSLTLQEAQTPSPPRPPSSTHNSETRKKVLSAIANNGYEDLKKRFPNPELFEGTIPTPATGDGQGPLSGISPHDPGIDISSLPGVGSWGSVVNKLRK